MTAPDTAQLQQRIRDLETQMRTAEQALQQQEQQLNAILHNSPGMIVRLRVEKNTIALELASDASEAIYGFTADEMQAEPQLFTSLVTQNQQHTFRELLTTTSQEQHNLDWIGQIRNRYGQTRWIHFAGRVTVEQQSTIIDGLVTDISADHAASEQQERLLSILEATTDIVAITDRSGQFEYINQAGLAILGMDTHQLKKTHFSALYNQADIAKFEEIIIPTALEEGVWSGELELHTANGNILPVSQVLVVHKDDRGKPRFFSTLLRDLSPIKQAEAERMQFQERIIQIQTSMIAELSTPLIPFMDGILVLPLIGAIDSIRAQTMIETVLSGVSQQQAHYVIIDITGVTVIDTQVASIFLQLAQSIQLLGAQTILTGIRPEVAQTIIGLGITFDSLITKSDLQAGIEHAVQWQR